MRINILPIHVCKRFICVYSLLLVVTGLYSQQAWVQVPTPDTSSSRNMLRGISGTSSADVWTVGSFEQSFTYPPYYQQKDLIMHWNGNGWQLFPPVVLSTTLDELWDVEAISANNVWAVGDYNNPNVNAKLLHYNGSTWSNQALPVITGGSYLYSIDANSASDIWAAGGKFGSPVRPAYVIHYNGSTWTDIAVPTVGSYWNVFNSIHGISANNVWAGGYWGNSYGDLHTLIMHWNGTNWINTALPASIVAQGGEILDIKMVAANDVWAVGYYLTGGLFKIHWNGSTWTESVPANGGGGTLAAVSANHVFSFGGEISRWNGSNWTVVDSLRHINYPALISSVTFPNGEIWAAGRRMNAAGSLFYTLVYRSVHNTPVFTRDSNQGWTARANATNSVDSVLKVQDADVSQMVTYSVVSAPAHGTLNGFPATAITSGGFAQPNVVSYTPVAGYTGSDQFIIKAAVGTVSSQTTINVNVSSALPLVLQRFTATKHTDKIVLEWSTLSEQNTDHFQIEKSLDGLHFSMIKAVAAKHNSSSLSTYLYNDHFPQTGTNYYRLKVIDVDGRTTVFPVQAVQWQSAVPSGFTIMSNPVTGNAIYLHINQKSKYTIALYNYAGIKIATQNIDATTENVRFVLPQSLKAGMYIITVKGQQETFSKAILINR